MATIGLATLHVAWLGSYVQVSDHDTGTALNSHADTTAVGTSTALVIHDYEQPIHVHGYTGEVLPDENCHVVSAVVAYDHPETGYIYACLQSSNSHQQVTNQPCLTYAAA